MCVCGSVCVLIRWEPEKNRLTMTSRMNDTSRWAVAPFVCIEHLSEMKECVICALLLTGHSQGTEVLHACCMFLSTPWYIYQYTRCDKTVYRTRTQDPYRIYLRIWNERCNNPQVATLGHEAIWALMIHKIHSWIWCITAASPFYIISPLQQ